MELGGSSQPMSAGEPEPVTPRPAEHVVVVASGKGGVGKSTVSLQPRILSHRRSTDGAVIRRARLSRGPERSEWLDRVGRRRQRPDGYSSQVDRSSQPDWCSLGRTTTR